MIDKEAKKILDLQLARGEISPEEYDKRLQKLATSDETPLNEARPQLDKIKEHLKTGELEGADLARVNWKKADLAGAKLAGANLTRAKLAKADFSQADLSGVKLTGADLNGVNFSNANLTGADLTGANCKEAIFDGATWIGTRGNEISAVASSWQGVIAKGAMLTDADLARSRLSEADLTDVDLSETDLSDAKLQQVKLTGGRLIRASLQNAQMENVDFTGVDATEVNLNLSALIDVDFSQAKLLRADISNAYLERVKLRSADCTGAVFNVSEHREVDLNEATLEEASFKSMTGYEEDELNQFAERGARVDKFYLRRFGRLIVRSHLAKVVLAVLVLTLIFGVMFYFNNPENWSYEKLDRVAQERRDISDYAGAEDLYKIILEKFANSAAKIAIARNTLGNLYLETKRFADAEALYQSVIQDYPDQTSAVLSAEIGLADILREQKKLDEAEAALLAITERFKDHPQAVDAWDRLAKIAKLRGDEDRAREIYETIIGKLALDENAVIGAQFDLAQMLHENRDFPGALAKYREIVERFGQGLAAPRALSSIIQLNVELGRLDEAEKVLAELRKKFPDQTSAILDGEMFIANALLTNSLREAEGLQRLQTILNEYPGTVKALWAGKNIAEYHIRNQRFEEAEALYRQLLETYKDNQRHRHDLLVQIASMEMRRGDPAAAITRLEEVLDQATEPEQLRAALMLYADALVAGGDVEGARKAFHRLGERFPEDINAQIAAVTGEARLLRKAGRIDEAIALFRKILEMTDQSAQRFNAYMEMTRIHRERENYTEEENILNEMMKVFADDPIIYAQVRLTYADNLRLQGKTDRALAILREVADTELPKRPADALNVMLSIYAEQGRLDQVAKIQEEIQRRFPGDQRAQLSARMETASLLWRSGQWQESIKEYEEIAAAGDPGFRMQALSSLLQLYTEQKRAGEAEAIYRTIQKEFPDSREVIDNANLVWATLLRFTGRGDQAVALYEELVNKHGGKIQALWALDGLAQYYLEAGQYEQAVQTYNRMLEEPAIQKHPEEKLKAYTGLGSVREAQRDYEQALQSYREALTLTQDRGKRLQVEQSIVRVLAELGNLAEAEQTLEQMKVNYPNSQSNLEVATFSVLTAMVKQNKLDEAIAGYEKIATTSKTPANRAAALGYIAQTQVSYGRLEDAERTYRRLLRAFPDDEEQKRNAELGIASVLKQQRKYKQALQAYQQLYEQYDDAEVRYQALSNIAKINEETGRPDQAREAYRKLREQLPDHPNAQATAISGLANLMARGGDIDGAIGMYRQVLDLDADTSIKIAALNSVAQLYIQQGRYEQARGVFEELAQNYSQQNELAMSARMGEADTLRQNGDYEGALKIYDKLLAQSGDPASKMRIRMSMARIKLDQKLYDEARAIFEEIRDNQAADATMRVDAQSGIADLLRRTGDLEGAAAIYQEVANKADDDNIRQFAKNAVAQIRIEQGRLAEAERIFREMNREHGDNVMIRVDALMGLGDVLNKRGQYEQALETYNQVRKISPGAQHDLWALTAIAQTYLAQRRYDDAIGVYREILSEHGDNHNARIDAELGIANVLKDKRSDQEAITAYQKIIENYPEAGQVYWALSGLAQLYALTGEVDKAAETYREIKRRFPENAQGLADAQLNFANLMKNSGRREEAEAAFNQVVETHPGSSQAAFAMEGLAQLSVEEQDYDGALAVYRKMIETYRNDPQIVFNARLGVGQVQNIRGDQEAATATYREALDNAPGNQSRVRALNMIAQSYMAQQQNTKAREIFEQIIKEFPNNEDALADARIGLGNALMQEQQPAKARSYYRQVAQDFRGRPRASAALQSLASAEIALGNIDAIDDIVEQLISDHPNDPNAVINVRMNAANKLRSEGKRAEALAQIEQIVKRYPTVPQTAWALHFQAQVEVEQQNFEEAAAVYNRVIEQYDSNLNAVIDAYFGLAEIDRMQRKLDEALAGYQKVVDQFPNYQQAINALNAIAQIYGERRQYLQQQAAYEKIISDFPNNTNAVLNAHISLANMLTARDRLDDALEHYNAVFEQYPESNQAPWAKAGAARLHSRLGHQDLAEKLFREIIETYPEDHEVVVGAKEFLKTLYDRQ